MKVTLKLTMLIAIFCSCVATEEPTPTTTTTPPTPTVTTDTLLEEGDIIVVSDGHDAVTALDSDGNFKATLYRITPAPTASNFRGLAWNSSTEEILVTFDHTTAGQERIYAISPVTGDVREFLYNNNVSGTLTGLTVLTDGTLLISEGTSMERFTNGTTRVNTGGWPFNGLATHNQMSAMTNGNFLNCNTCAVAGGLRIYNGTTAATVSNIYSGSAAPCINGYIIYGCMQMSNGSIATAQNGAADTVRIYNSGLTSYTDFSDLNYLADARFLAQRSNGNLLVTDGTFHHIVELTSAGIFVQILGMGILSTPTHIMVLPSF